jgi:hypothetical protein
MTDIAVDTNMNITIMTKIKTAIIGMRKIRIANNKELRNEKVRWYTKKEDTANFAFWLFNLHGILISLNGCYVLHTTLMRKMANYMSLKTKLKQAL